MIVESCVRYVPKTLHEHGAGRALWSATMRRDHAGQMWDKSLATPFVT